MTSKCKTLFIRSDASELIVRGDVNADGEFSVADLVLLQKWLLAVPDTNLPDWQAGDLCADGKLNIFDLCAMRVMLLNQ